MDDCISPGLMPLQQALEKQLEVISPENASESVGLSDAMGRVAAEHVKANINVPTADNSAMDGYAIALDDDSTRTAYRLVGTALAGHAYNETLTPGEAIRIMTGAPIPKGANCVVMQEKSHVQQDRVSFDGELKKGQNIRLAGSDIAKGSTLFASGTKLTAAHIAMLASLGSNAISVFKKITVGIVSTGDELVEPGHEIGEGQIYECNRYGLKAMLSKLPVEVIDYGILPDNPDTIKATFLKASTECQWLLSSGGVSVGDADYVKTILEDIGNIGFWKVAIKPGKPYAFGKISQCWFSGLPGNPVSSFVTFLQLVVPCLQKLAGEKNTESTIMQAELSCDINRPSGRLDFQRGTFYQSSDGVLHATPIEKQSSAMMTSFLQANCFILVPANSSHLSKGSQVNILPFGYLLN